MQRTTTHRLAIAVTVVALAGCSSTPKQQQPETNQLPVYKFTDVAHNFIAENAERSSGTVVDKGFFNPKKNNSFGYRYCASSPDAASTDMEAFKLLAQSTCDTNLGTMVDLPHGTWCVYNPNTPEEAPIFSAYISDSDLWTDLCPTGPFVTMKVNENREYTKDQWFKEAQVLGYEPYSIHRKVKPVKSGVRSESFRTTPATDKNLDTWADESYYIYKNIGATVCLVDKQKSVPYDVTYRGKVVSAKDGRVRVLATQKFKGDVRTAPKYEVLPWHKKAYINADVNSWFLCE
ncbi:hypothetical protein [Photobacterium damselae]|uniref:hypothetical protein n=1 Tax=Photobacterium damselae TaxID=38293 RepID=UPI0025436974